MLVAAMAISFLGLAGTSEAELTGVEKTDHFDLRFRPGSRAEASVDRVASMVETELGVILNELALKRFDHRIRLFLYDDTDELSAVTGVSGTGGFAIPLEMHIPHDNDQTRKHEMVHVVAEKLPESGEEPRNLFFAEGLANAILRFVHGVPVDAVAAFYLERGELPALGEIHAIGDFYAWLGAHPGFNGYDVAGSYLRYVLDTFGPQRTRRYYRGVPAKKALGVDLDKVEEGWHRRLRAFPMRTGLLALLRERAGESPAFAKRTEPEQQLTDDILGPKREWRSLKGGDFKVEGPGEIRARDDGFVGTSPSSDGTWTVARFGPPRQDAMIRVTAAPTGSCWGVKVQLGEKCQGMILGQGVFIYTDVGGVAHDPNVKLGADSVELVLRRRGSQATLWIDGRKVAEANVEPEAAAIGLGLVMGEARFTDFAVREL